MHRNLICGKNSIILYYQNYHKCTLGFAKLRNKHSYDDLKYGNELLISSVEWVWFDCGCATRTDQTAEVMAVMVRVVKFGYFPAHI